MFPIFEPIVCVIEVSFRSALASPFTQNQNVIWVIYGKRRSNTGSIFFPPIRARMQCNLLQSHCKLKSVAALVAGITSRHASCSNMLLVEGMSSSLNGMLLIIVTRVATRAMFFLPCSATALHEKLNKN